MKKLLFTGLMFPLLAFAQQKHHTKEYPIDLEKAKFHTSHQSVSRSTSAEFTIQSILTHYSSDRVSFQLLNETKSLVGRHLLYQQYIDGIKLYGAHLKINVANSGKLLSILENTYSPKEFETITPFLTENNEGQETVFYYDGDRLTLGKVHQVENAPGQWEEIIEDSKGNLAYEKNLTMYHHHKHQDTDTTAKAFVFYPNPVISGNTTYGGDYVDNNDNNSSTMEQERKLVDIKVTYDNNLFKLENDYVKITEHSFPTDVPSTSSTPSFLFDRSEKGFEEVNVLYHITEFQEFLQSLGFTNLANYQLPVDPHAFNNDDNSAFNYVPAPSLSFGEGGVDDAEDAQVVLHEYGHALMHSAAPFTNSGSERNALDEANGDYLASSYTRLLHNYDWHKVFSWDGHNEFWNGRLSKTTKKYPDDILNNLYLDAPIWSASLMQIEENISRDQTTKILFQSAYSYSTNMTMADAAQLYIQADSLLNSGANYPYICHIFKDRGLVNNCNADRPIFIGISSTDVTKSNRAIVVHSQEFLIGSSPLGIMTPTANVEYTIYDITGKMIRSGNSNNSTIVVQPNEFTSGTYIIKMKGNNYTESIKFVR